MMKLQPAMAEALRLTRSGRLHAATRLIQSTLIGGGSGYASPRTSTPVAPEGEVIDVTPRRIALAPNFRKTTAKPATARRPESAVHSRFEERCYAGLEGAMTYWLYLPAGATPAMPLVVMLHGCTQDPQDFARGTGMNALADELGFIVAYPCQPAAANMKKCWNWFKPGDQQRDRGEPALIAAVTRTVIRDHDADPARIYVAGLSAGGAAAAIMGSVYPDVYAAIGIHSGLACGAASSMWTAFSAMRSGGMKASAQTADERFVPVITFHGDSDTTVHAVNSAQIVAAATLRSDTPLTTRTEKGVSQGNRNYSRTISYGPDDQSLIEEWTIHGAGHAWSGGDTSGSYTDSSGPDASRAMLTFFLQHSLPQ
ncbi:PHB depolymerase family esterase [Blastomonas sp.]|uniref:extracellular catalytic domain type 1 short-chain-length polyhydroxyalkanoate depolymerase n=1 Tax=Blastomonas sp. TaxID=1909299 RepID=UPI00359455DF